MLTTYHEYILLIAGYLDANLIDKWVESGGDNWESFFKFLERSAKLARQKQILENTGLRAAPISSPAEDSSCSIKSSYLALSDKYRPHFWHC